MCKKLKNVMTNLAKNKNLLLIIMWYFIFFL